MKIHYLITTFDGGGAEFAIVPIVKFFREMGHEVSVTACEAGDMLAAERLEEAGFSVNVLYGKRISKFRHVIKFIQLIRKTGRPDILMTSLTRATTVGQIVGKILGIPVVSWKNSATLKFSTSLLRHLSDLWVADSYMVKDFVHDRMKISPRNVIAWPLFYCDYLPGNRDYWTGERPLRIGSIGRLHPQKNYSAFLRGIALFLEKYPHYADEISVSILGDGPSRTSIEEDIKRLNLEGHVRLLGYSSDIYAYLETLDLYVQPSLYEGLCIAAHEALSTGLPLAATQVGELKSSLEQDTGFIIKGDVPEVICSIFESLFKNPFILGIKGKNALTYMQDYYSKDAFEKAGKEVLERMEALRRFRSF